LETIHLLGLFPWITPRRFGLNTRIIQIIVGIACTFSFLALALHHVPRDAVGASLASADPIWIGAAMFAYAVNLALRAWRWQMILAPVAAVPYPTVARVLLVGYGSNTIMPARLGELFRAEFCKTSFGLSRVWALTSIVVERLLDGLTVVACLGAGLLLAARTRAPAGLLIDVLAVGGAVFGAILIVALCLGGPRISGLFAGFPRFSNQLIAVCQGLAILRTRRTMQIAILTLVIYVPDALSLWCIVNAVGLGLGLTDTLVLVGAASLRTLLPSAPPFSAPCSGATCWPSSSPAPKVRSASRPRRFPSSACSFLSPSLPPPFSSTAREASCVTP
jgi:glycosyltransferase 2 family protein